MKYLIFDRNDRGVSCLLFGSSAWSAKERDAFIGWDKQARQRNLNLTTTNTRFLILPWVHVSHLTSHLLAMVARRIRHDCLEKYAHPVEVLETFVKKDRFKGTCYRATNWIYVADTQGRSGNSRSNQPGVPIKAILLYPLNPKFRKVLQRV